MAATKQEDTDMTTNSSLLAYNDPPPSLVFKGEDDDDDDDDKETIADCVVAGIDQKDQMDYSLIFEIAAKHAPRWFPTSREHLVNARLQCMQPVTRKDVSRHLRAPLPGQDERPCGRGDACHARDLAVPPGVAPVTLVEYLSLEQRGKPRPVAPQACIVCQRYQANYAWINALAEQGRTTPLFLNLFNIADSYGEYTLRQCLVIGSAETHGFLTPVVQHVKSNYEYRPPDGEVPVDHFVESGYDYPPVFRDAAASM